MANTIWTDKPLVITEAELKGPRAEEALWEQAVYPIGNGRLGAAAFGEPRRERIQFNQDSLWVGNEDNTGACQPFGDLFIETGHAEYEDYRRELDIARGVQTITYRAGGVGYTRQYVASYPAQCLVLQFTADQPGSCSGTAWLGNCHDIPTTAEEATLIMRGDTGSLSYWRRLLAEPKRLIADRAYASGRNIDLDFEACVRLLHQGGTCTVVNNTLVFKDCDSVTFLLAAETSYVADRDKGWCGEHPHERVCGCLDAAAKRSCDELLQEHIADFQSIFGRMQFSLGEIAPEVEQQTTEARLQTYRAAFEAGQPATDHALEVLLYHYARYLMISSSRPGHGALPANLQGIWLINKHPSWRCDFHTDINIQMNYWFVDAANLSECFEPLACWIDSIREVRKAETRRVLGVARGWLTRSENGIFGGSTWHIQKGDSAWLCQNLWDHYTFTRDKAYLVRYAYPVMKEISEFWLDHLVEGPGGQFVAPAGRSPEHGPVGVDGVTYDQQLCAELFDNTMAAADELGLDPEFRAELADKRARLLGPQIGRWGQFQEWQEDIDDPADDHRHINHLIGVYPGSQVDPVRTPALAAAARVSLEARRDHGQGHPGWSRVWKACLFARLLDGESAYGQLSETLATHIYRNLWAVHPPFQIDANFGFAAAVNEMLVQSISDLSAHTIHLLPALPAAWPDGEVKGMRVRGGYALDMAWKDGTLLSATLHGVSNAEKTCEVRYGETRHMVAVKRGGCCCLEVGRFGARVPLLS